MNIVTKPTLIAVTEGASPLDVLAARHRAAWDKTQHGRAEWIEGTLELAAVLAEERKAIPADQEWSRWLERNELKAKPNDHDRAALVHMGKIDSAVLREALEKTKSVSHQLIWEKELRPRFASVSKPQQAPAKRATKIERRLIDQVLKLHCDQGHSYKETAEELGLTIGKVASMVRRFGNSRQPEAPPPRTKEEFTGLKTLTREQVDPDFVGDDLAFRTKYGHVPLHTKTQIEENKRQEVLSTWLAAVSDFERAARAFNAEPPDQNTLRQWLTKQGKAEKLSAWLAAIETAYRNAISCLDLVRSQQKQ